MKQAVLKLLDFLSLLSNDGKLSITNIAVIILLTKIALSPAVSLTEAATLFITMMNYSHKRVVVSQAESEDETK